MRIHLLLLCLVASFALSGCGNSSDPVAPSDDELTGFLDENPEYLTYEDEEEEED